MALTSEQIAKALEANAGFISGAAKSLNVTYQAISQRIKTNKHLKQIQEAITESHLDLAESKLLTNIKDGNMTGICFFLKCRGKERGYIETVNLNHGGNKENPVQVEIPALMEKLKRMAETE